jgi:hypothetical protein
MSQHFPFRYSKISRSIIRLAACCFPAGAIHVPFKALHMLGVRTFGCVGVEERHLHSRLNFKLNRAALTEWRQLLSA